MEGNQLGGLNKNTNGGSDVSDFNLLGDSREPYEGFLGGLEYLWTGGNENGIHYDRDGNPTGPAPVTGIAPDISPAGKIFKYGKLLSPSNYRAALSNYKQMLAHVRKLRQYTANPSNFDNAGHLMRNAGNPQIQQQIISGRINHLQQEINTFYNNIIKLF